MEDKAEQVKEILDVSEQLTGTLSTLNREKDLLTTSLRQEAAYNRQLEEEKVPRSQGLYHGLCYRGLVVCFNWDVMPSRVSLFLVCVSGHQ